MPDKHRSGALLFRDCIPIILLKLKDMVQKIALLSSGKRLSELKRIISYRKIREISSRNVAPSMDRNTLHAPQLIADIVVLHR